MSDMNEDVHALAVKRKLVKVLEVPLSKDQPFQILRRRNEVFLYGCKTPLEVDAFLMRTSVQSLMGGEVRSRRNTR